MSLRRTPQGITEIGRAAMVVEGEEVPDDVLKAEEKAKDHAAPHVNFYDPSVYKDLQGHGGGGEEQARRIKDFFTALALCHTVIPERFEDTDEPFPPSPHQVILSASSPDDEALVLGAKYFGFEFVNRIDSSAILHTWDVLHVLGFTSDRKRMSVIVRTAEGTIKIICKGADT
ncbi:unnamed protein product, partial [Hapterophycus canaliculatus]